MCFLWGKKSFVLQSLTYYGGCANPQATKYRFFVLKNWVQIQNIEFGSDTLSRNVGKNLPLYSGDIPKDAGALYSNQTSRGEG